MAEQNGLNKASIIVGILATVVMILTVLLIQPIKSELERLRKDNTEQHRDIIKGVNELTTRMRIIEREQAQLEIRVSIIEKQINKK